MPYTMKVETQVCSESEDDSGEDEEDEEESETESLSQTIPEDKETEIKTVDPDQTNPLEERENEDDWDHALEKPKTDFTSDSADQSKKKKKKKRRIIGINLTNCKYESVHRAARVSELKEVGDEEEWTVYWTDCSVSLERVMDMKRFQKINHFPGMSEICRKDLLARNMNRLLKLFPKEYNIFPRTWCLPAELGNTLHLFGVQRMRRASNRGRGRVARGSGVAAARRGRGHSVPTTRPNETPFSGARKHLMT